MSNDGSRQVSRTRELARNARYFMRLLGDRGQSRFAFRWLESLSRDYLLRKPSPWLTFSSIDYLTGWIGDRTDLRVFEYGSGGSTIFWGKHSGLVVSIEHDEQWYQRVNAHIQKKAVHDFRLVLPEKVADECAAFDPADPALFRTSDESLRDFSFQKYVSQIQDFPDHFFDIILVDGRSRPACIISSVAKIKKGGLLIIDNADIDYYFKFTSPILISFLKLEFTGIGPLNKYTWQTAIYRC